LVEVEENEEVEDDYITRTYTFYNEYDNSILFKVNANEFEATTSFTTENLMCGKLVYPKSNSELETIGLFLFSQYEVAFSNIHLSNDLVFSPVNTAHVRHDNEDKPSWLKISKKMKNIPNSDPRKVSILEQPKDIDFTKEFYGTSDETHRALRYLIYEIFANRSYKPLATYESYDDDSDESYEE